MMGEGDEFWQHKQASGNLNCLVDIWCLWWAQIIINNRKSRAHCYSLLLPLHLSFSPFVGYSVVLYSLISCQTTQNLGKCMWKVYIFLNVWIFLFVIYCSHESHVHITSAFQICVSCIFLGQIQLRDQIVAITLSFSNLPLKLPLAVLTSETTIISLLCFSPKVLSVTLSPFAYSPCQTTHCNILSSV